MGGRLTWPQIRQSAEFRGLWVALDDCQYDARTAQPVEGTVVDFDEDLVELCTRLRQAENRHCAIVFCAADPAYDDAPIVTRSLPPPPLAEPAPIAITPPARPSYPSTH